MELLARRGPFTHSISIFAGDTKGGRDQDAGASEGSAKEGKQEGEAEGDENESCEWAKVSENAFGAFIHVGLQSGLKSAVVKTGPMLILSLLIQFIFSEELIVQHAGEALGR